METTAILINSIFSSKLCDKINDIYCCDIEIKDGTRTMNVSTLIVYTYIPVLDNLISNASGKYDKKVKYSDLKLPSSTSYIDLERLLSWYYGLSILVTQKEVERMYELAEYLKCEEFIEALNKTISQLRSK